MIQENNAKLAVSEHILADGNVFYNPKMKHNRDVCIEVLKTLPHQAKVALPLAGSGVRAIRILQETKLHNLYANDWSEKAVEAIKKNLKENNTKCTVTNMRADSFLFTNGPFNYIDIDPFGSPLPFLASAIQNAVHNGIVAVTATDLAALCSKSKQTHKRRYWGIPADVYWQHEFGIRTLIRSCQQIGFLYEIALVPLLSYHKDHYYRVYFRVKKSRSVCDKQKYEFIFDQEKKQCGPIYVGSLADSKFLEQIHVDDWFEKLKLEFAISQVGYVHMGKFAKQHQLTNIPSFERIQQYCEKKNILLCKSTFEKESIRINLPEEKIKKVLQKLSRVHGEHQ
ncbi:MAG: hypothetical protein ACMXYF_04165 [Candidatus Woesearchaeota archaeon]